MKKRLFLFEYAKLVLVGIVVVVFMEIMMMSASCSTKDRVPDTGFVEDPKWVAKSKEDPFRKSNDRFIVVNPPRSRVPITKLAIIELIPTETRLDMIELVGNFITIEERFTAVECRMIDGGTGIVVAAVANDKAGCATAFSGADFT